METEEKHPGLKAKWRKILKGTPTKEQLHQFLKDLQKEQNLEHSNAVTS